MVNDLLALVKQPLHIRRCHATFFQYQNAFLYAMPKTSWALTATAPFVLKMKITCMKKKKKKRRHLL